MNSYNERELHRENQSLARLVACSLDGIIMTDELGLIVEWNPALEQLTGIPYSSAAGQYIWEILSRLTPVSQQSLERIELERIFIREMLTSGSAHGSHQLYERQIQGADQAIRTVQVSVFTVPTDHGYRLANIIRDVTSSKAVESQLKTLLRAVEQSPTTVVITDSNGHIEYANPRLTELTGFTFDEVRGKTPRVFKSDQTSQEIYQELWTTIKRGQDWRGQLVNRKKDGTLFWEDMSISPVFDDDGTIRHFVAMKEDVTSRKQGEQALKESEERFRTTFEQVAVGIAHVALDGHFLLINQRFCDLVGYTSAEMLSKSFQDIIHPDDLDIDLEQVRRMLAHEIETYTLEKRYIRKDASIQWVQLTVSLAWSDNGQPQYFISVVQDISKRKQAEQALRESEERFRTLVSSTDDIVFTLDRLHRHTGVYGRWLANYHLSQQDFLGKTAREIMGVEAAQVHEAAISSTLLGMSTTYEWNNGERFFQTSLSPLLDETHRIYGVVGIGRDITALKMIETQLRASEQLVRSAIDALSAEIAILDETGNIIAVNQSWRDFATANAVDSSSLCEGVNYLATLDAVDSKSEDYETASIFADGIRSVVNGDLKEFFLEYPCHSPIEKRWFIGRVTRFAGSAPARLVVAHENITERKLSEITVRETLQELAQLHEFVRNQNAQLSQTVSERTEQLQRVNNHMLTVLNNVSDAIVLLTAEGRIEDSNLSFDQLFGYEHDEMFGESIRCIANESTVALLDKAVKNVCENHETQRFQIAAQRKDKSTFDADVALSYVKNNTGHLIFSIRDISHLKELERSKDAFISMVSHELRTPVSTIMLSSETMKRYYERLSDEQKLHKLDQIHQQAARLTELMTAILDTARFDARHNGSSREIVDLVETLQQVVPELRPQAEANQQQLKLVMPKTPQFILGDFIDITRIWRNLIGNAIKYAGGKREIVVSIYSTGQTLPDSLSAIQLSSSSAIHDGYVLGVVSDNGPGMRHEDLPQLFTRFFRGWAAGTNIPGTGLGLSLVKDILQSYGGDIAVQSELGVGTTFCFWLPIEKEKAQ